MVKKNDALIIKGVFGKFKKFVNWKKFKNEKYKKKGACYNCDTKGHFARECLSQEKTRLEEQI
jgi:hypothetical protein